MAAVQAKKEELEALTCLKIKSSTSVLIGQDYLALPPRWLQDVKFHHLTSISGLFYSGDVESALCRTELSYLTELSMDFNALSDTETVSRIFNHAPKLRTLDLHIHQEEWAASSFEQLHLLRGLVGLNQTQIDSFSFLFTGKDLEWSDWPLLGQSCNKVKHLRYGSRQSDMHWIADAMAEFPELTSLTVVVPTTAKLCHLGEIQNLEEFHLVHFPRKDDDDDDDLDWDQFENRVIFCMNLMFQLMNHPTEESRLLNASLECLKQVDAFLYQKDPSGISMGYERQKRDFFKFLEFNNFQHQHQILSAMLSFCNAKSIPLCSSLYTLAPESIFPLLFTKRFQRLHSPLPKIKPTNNNNNNKRSRSVS